MTSWKKSKNCFLMLEVKNLLYRKNINDPPILKEKVETAIKKMKNRKAAFRALEDFGIELLTKLYDSGEIPTDLKKSIFTALPRKAGSTDCEIHRTISLINHIIKVILRILMMRNRKKIRNEISEEQYGFLKDKGTRNATFLLRMIAERIIAVQKDVNICFFDHAKAFDKVRHSDAERGGGQGSSCFQGGRGGQEVPCSIL